MKIDKGTLLQEGKYEIVSILGEGGFGITYLAIQKSLSRKVAIKEFFKKDCCQRDSETTMVTIGTDNNRIVFEQYKNKFIKEAQTISNLQHNQIIRIFDVFEENGTAYYVMEYLPGGDLSERIPQDGMDEQKGINYIIQIAEAMDFIHQNNVLHLDIKPSNILFRNQDVPVLIDFGVSKHYDSESGDATTNTVQGISDGYSPPEQYYLDGVKNFSPATDIYALGATFFHLLTGKRPPSANYVQNEGLPELPATVSSQSVETIKKAMSPRKVERFQDIKTFLASLQKPVNPVKPVVKPIVPEKKENELPKADSDKQPDDKLSWLSEKPRIYKDEAEKAKALLKAKNFAEQKAEQDYINGKKRTEQWISDNTKKPKPSPVVRYGIISIIVIALACIVLNVMIPDDPTPGETISEELNEIELSNKKMSKLEHDNDNIISLSSWKYVDLGLSVLWAKRNDVNFSKNQDVAGTYEHFYWGQEMDYVNSYSIENCKTWNMDITNISGNRDYDLCMQHGDGWRLPTKAEMEELLNKCKWEWTSQDNEYGYLITGPNGNSIFLKADGQWANKTHSFEGEQGYYLTSESNNPKACWILQFDANNRKIAPSMRYQGNSIRAVKDKNTSNVSGTMQDAIDFYENKKYTKAVPLFMKYAQQGNANAQVRLGYCYFFGQGVPQDYKKALFWFNKAAEQGYDDAKTAIETIKEEMKYQ